ncbi:MAG: tetratricopeptide repeat protein [Acidobacteriota bacterium]
MDREHRHDLKHDKFVDEIGALSQRARANQRQLLGIAGGVIAIAIIAFGIYFYRGNREKTAQQALAVAIETSAATIADKPPANSTGPFFKTEPERTAAADRLFKDVQAKYPGSDAADVAGLYLARTALAGGDTKKARQLLETFVSDHGDNILARTARFSLYQLRIENGEAAQVATELDAEMAKSEPVLPGDSILLLQAQAYEAQGNSAKSKEAYRRITTEFPESPFVVDAARKAGQA